MQSEGTLTSSTPEQDQKIEGSLKHSLKDAAGYATMIGVGETYLSAFALFLRATTPQIGLLASFPPLLGSLMQALSAWLGRQPGRRKRIVLAGASLQGIAWLPLFLLPVLFREHAILLLIACATVYQAGGHLAAPQWGSLMGDIVPLRRRGRFFALRTSIVSGVTFTALAAGGLVLHFTNQSGYTIAGFGALFAVALLARFVSVYHLSRMVDPPGHTAAIEIPVSQVWWRRLRHSDFARFSLFFALMQFSVAIASPFFTVYMLRDLQFSYLAFMANTGTAILAQLLTLNRWGRISDIFGNRRILAVTGTIIPLLPLLWIFSSNFWYLLVVQVISGMAWAGFTLSASNFLYDLIAREKRATYLAIHSLLANVGIFCGAVLGGYLGTILPTEIELFSVRFSWASQLLGVFVISTLVRTLIVLLLVPRIREVRNVRPISVGNLIFRVTRVNALAGLVFEILGARNKAPRPPEDQ